MGFVKSLQLKMAKIGLKSMRNANEDLRDSEEFVKSCINAKGVKEFKLASDRLKSDAEFILTIVKNHPEILQYCAKDIYDRYVDVSFIVVEDQLVDEMIFAIKCLNENIESFKYLPRSIAYKYYRASKNGETVVGNYHGKQESYTLNKDADYLQTIQNIRFGAVECDFNK